MKNTNEGIAIGLFESMPNVFLCIRRCGVFSSRMTTDTLTFVLIPLDILLKRNVVGYEGFLVFINIIRFTFGDIRHSNGLRIFISNPFEERDYISTKGIEGSHLKVRYVL